MLCVYIYDQDPIDHYIYICVTHRFTVCQCKMCTRPQTAGRYSEGAPA